MAINKPILRKKNDKCPELWRSLWYLSQRRVSLVKSESELKNGLIKQKKTFKNTSLANKLAYYEIPEQQRLSLQRVEVKIVRLGINCCYCHCLLHDLFLGRSCIYLKGIHREQLTFLFALKKLPSPVLHHSIKYDCMDFWAWWKYFSLGFIL